MKEPFLRLKSWFVFLLFPLFVLSCDSDKDESLPSIPEGSITAWTKRMNDDIVSLKNIVVAIQEKDSVETISIDGNKYTLQLAEVGAVSFELDHANYDAPLLGIHKIDNDYFWIKTIGTGTSSTTLLKNENRENYVVSEKGITPRLIIGNQGNWIIDVDGREEMVYQPADGKLMRAIGSKALFNSITFDVDSNAVILTNELPAREYILPKLRPFTLLLSVSEATELKIASGFTIPVDFKCTGLVDMEFKLPKAWSANFTLGEDTKAGVIYITAPTGMEAEYDDSGVIEVIAIDKYGKKLVRKISVLTEMGLVNYASIDFVDLVTGIDIESAIFTFTEDNTSANTNSVTSIKAGNSFRLMLPDGYPYLRSITFTTTEEQGSKKFDYYFPPSKMLVIGDQDISLSPPKILTYWKGGLIVQVNETSAIGIDSYNITGKVVAVNICTTTRVWFPNGNIDVTDANNTDDGSVNTPAIISALGGPGTTDAYAARWAIRVRDGGYSNWYLPANNEYELYNIIWQANKKKVYDLMVEYGDNPMIDGTHNTFWTSTNISKTHAGMYDARDGGKVTTGQKIYGCRLLAFRKF